jgi:hypothetical protein
MMITQIALSWALPPGTRFTRAISDRPPTMIYEFATERGSVFIAWSSAPVTINARTQAALRDAKVYNVVGQPQEELSELGECPVYVLAGAQEARVREGFRMVVNPGL